MYKIFGTCYIIAVYFLANTLLSAQTGSLEIIKNGNFSNGQTAYTSQYSIFDVMHSGSGEGTYSICQNPQAVYFEYKEMADHSGDEQKLMFFVNGDSIIGNTRVFLEQRLPELDKNSNYRISFYAADNAGKNSAFLRIKFNGVPATNGFFKLSAEKTLQWFRYEFDWNSADNDNPLIQFTDETYDKFGNDFAIDDISVRKICDWKSELPDTIKLCEGATSKFSLNIPKDIKNPICEWTPSTNIDLSDPFNPAVTGKSSEKYYVKIADRFGCEVLDSIYVKVIETPNVQAISLNGVNRICPCQDLVLSVPSGYEYKWSDGSITPSIQVKNPGKYSVEISKEGMCSIVLDTIVLPSETNLTFKIDSISIKSGEKLALPIKIFAGKDLGNCGIDNFDISLTYNKSLLVPEKNSELAIDNDGGNETIRFNAKIPADSIIKILSFNTALGDAKCSELNIIVKNSYCPSLEINKTNGKLCINNVCSEPTDRLISLNGDEFLSAVYPTPSISTSKIIFSSPESGECYIELYNYIGDKVGELFRGIVDNQTKTVEFDASTLDAGLYYYVLHTPSERYTKTMVVIK
jgi:hypothetical protein